MRQEGVDVLARGGCQPGEDVEQPGFEVDAVVLAGDGHAVDDGGHFPAAVVAEKQPVLASQRPGADGVLGGVVVNADMEVVQEHLELVLLLQRVVGGLDHRVGRGPAAGHDVLAKLQVLFDEQTRPPAESLPGFDQGRLGLAPGGGVHGQAFVQVHLTDQAQSLQAAGIVHGRDLVELPTGMRPAGAAGPGQEVVRGTRVADVRSEVVPH